VCRGNVLYPGRDDVLDGPAGLGRASRRRRQRPDGADRDEDRQYGRPACRVPLRGHGSSRYSRRRLSTTESSVPRVGARTGAAAGDDAARRVPAVPVCE
jgi:hypothetical protein